MQIKLLRSVLASTLAVLALVLVACGGDSDDEAAADLGPDPATMVPADAPFYYEQVVRPEGEIGDQLDSALQKLLATDDPGGIIVEALDEELSEEGFSYSEDIEPWLGARAGLFLTDYDPETDEAVGAGAVAVTDPDAAADFVDRALEADGIETEQVDYEGSTYQLDGADDTATGVVGDFLVVGNQDGVEAAIDASAGDSLADDSDATEGREPIPGDSLLSAYVDTPQVLQLIEESGALSPEELQQFQAQIEGYSDAPVAFWGTASEDTMALSASTPTLDGSGESTDLVGGFPADAWLAFASGDVGEQIEQQIKQFEAGFEAGFESGAPGIEAPDLEAEVEQAIGLNLSEDFSWIGSIGGFVQGTSLFGLGGGIVIEATDEDQAAETLAKVEGALGREQALQISPSGEDGFRIQVAGAPFGAEVGLEDGKVVVAAGAATVEDVLSPSDALADAEAFSSATDALGEDLSPAFFLDFDPVLDLVESSGQVDDPGYEEAKPYLANLDYLVAGSAIEGETTISSLVLGLQEGSSEEATAATITP